MMTDYKMTTDYKMMIDYKMIVDYKMTIDHCHTLIELTLSHMSHKYASMVTTNTMREVSYYVTHVTQICLNESNTMSHMCHRDNTTDP
jgi:putative IMPACT (imprinted ancient) family translation regulator